MLAIGNVPYHIMSADPCITRVL